MASRIVRESTLAAHLKGDARGDVRLDDPGDHIHARPLRGHDAMNARGPRHLRDAGDGHLHVRRRHEHQVRQFVDDDDDVAEFLRDDDVVLPRDDDFLVHLDGEAFGARLDFFLLRHEGQLGLLLRQGLVFRARIEGGDVADADFGENLVALFHLVDDPAQREDDLLRIGDHGHDEVRQGVVLLQLDDFRIDHHEPELVRREAVQERGDDGIDADRLARARAAGDEQVRHLRQVGDDGMAVNVLAQRQRDPALAFRHSSDSIRSRMMTAVLTELGTSMPTELLPGTGARMLMRSALSAAAMLLLRPVIFSSFTPGAGCSS